MGLYFLIAVFVLLVCFYYLFIHLLFVKLLFIFKLNEKGPLYTSPTWVIIAITLINNPYVTVHVSRNTYLAPPAPTLYLYMVNLN